MKKKGERERSDERLAFVAAVKRGTLIETNRGMEKPDHYGHIKRPLEPRTVRGESGLAWWAQTRRVTGRGRCCEGGWGRDWQRVMRMTVDADQDKWGIRAWVARRGTQVCRAWLDKKEIGECHRLECARVPCAATSALRIDLAGRCGKAVADVDVAEDVDHMPADAPLRWMADLVAEHCLNDTMETAHGAGGAAIAALGQGGADAGMADADVAEQASAYDAEGGHADGAGVGGGEVQSDTWPPGWCTRRDCRSVSSGVAPTTRRRSLSSVLRRRNSTSRCRTKRQHGSMSRCRTLRHWRKRRRRSELRSTARMRRSQSTWWTRRRRCRCAYGNGGQGRHGRRCGGRGATRRRRRARLASELRSRWANR